MHHQSPGVSGDQYGYGSSLPPVSTLEPQIPPSPAEFGHPSSVDPYSNMEIEDERGTSSSYRPTMNSPNTQSTHPIANSPLSIQQLQTFTQNHSLQNVTSFSPQMGSMAQFKVSQWQNKNFDSGVQTMNHSQVPSVMSMASLNAPSMMSGVSSMADELARTELTDQQQQRFENLPLGYRQDSSKALSAMPSLIQLMKDTDEVVVLKAVGIVQNIARQDDNERRVPPVIQGPEVPEVLREVMVRWRSKQKIVRTCLCTLFHLCGRSQDQEALRHVIRISEEQNWALLTDLIAFIGQEENSCWRYATLILHSIVSEKNVGIEALIQARKLGALRALASKLVPNHSEKLLSVVVELCRLVVDKDLESKHNFLELGGIPKLLRMLSSCQYENLLWRTTQLLNYFSNYDPGSLVGCGAHKILCRMLLHGSPRVLNSALECLRNISDVACEDVDCLPLLETLLRFLGNDNLKIVLYGVQIIGNMCANNKLRKEHLVQMNAVNLLLRQLCMPSNHPPLEEECHCEVLDLLRSLSLGHEKVQDVQVMLFENPDIYLQKLAQLRPAVLKKTLQVLIHAAKNDANLPKFINVRQYQYPNRQPITFVSLIIYVLHISCKQYPENKIVENVSLPDLIHYAMATLQQLARDKHLLNEICTYLAMPKHQISNVILPVYVLVQQFREEPIIRSALGLHTYLVTLPEMATLLALNPHFVKVVSQHKQSQNQAIETYASRVLSLIQGTEYRMQLEEPKTSRPQRRHGSPIRPLDSLQQYVASHQASPPPGPSHEQLADYGLSPLTETPRRAAGPEMGTMENLSNDNWPDDLNDVHDTLNPFVNVFCGNEQPAAYQPPDIPYYPQQPMDTGGGPDIGHPPLPHPHYYQRPLPSPHNTYIPQHRQMEHYDPAYYDYRTAN
ncbi:unnamed protein product, partial [Mesorhabditis spiculigera]